MFERRLKYLTVFFAAIVLLLVGRLTQVQVFGHGYFTRLAEEAMTEKDYVETTRGAILDVRGRVIAEDVACIDAAVDYRAVTRDLDQPFVQKWIEQLAAQRLRSRTDSGWQSADAKRRRELRAAEAQRVREDIAAMWPRLAQLAGTSIEDMDDIRSSIDLKVRIRQRKNTYRKYEAAVGEEKNKPAPPWYQRWLLSGEGELPTEDEFEEVIAEQTAPHVILRAIPREVQNELGKNPDRYPGLTLQPSAHRNYPYGPQAAHVIGHLRRVNPSDLAGDPNPKNDLLRYEPNDLIGGAGIEALAEQMLRGTRGMEAYSTANNATAARERVDPLPGRSVTSTINIELQAQIRQEFTEVKIPHPDYRNNGETKAVTMHGAAIVIDVASGEVRALVSYPDYDLNTINEMYQQLMGDVRNTPLFNRATMSQYEPGSTVKPIVGVSAISAGLARLDERIECTGFLFLRGRQWDRGRCWTATIDTQNYPHHSVPSDDPHLGPTPDLNGHLNFTEAVQRSCNVYFENMADRLGQEGLSAAFERFGIGRYTGIGIPEQPGRVPRQYRGAAATFATWTAGIGQGSVLATPLQVANAMATLARGGVWIRPTLVHDGSNLTPWQPPTSKSQHGNWPDRVDLKLDPATVKAAQRGMALVVSSKAGTGHAARRPDVAVAAKTGTAQAEFFKVPMLDEHGDLVRDAKGNKVWLKQRPSTWLNENPELPWYRASDMTGEKVHHSWFVGFAPADNPTIAFAVMVEYGGAGGNAVAGPVASKLLDACIEHGYIAVKK